MLIHLCLNRYVLVIFYVLAISCRSESSNKSLVVLAKIEMNGDKNQSIVQQSAGLHLIEVNNSGDCKGSWSYAEYAVVLLVFVLILKCSHLCHYCLLTKKLVKSKVAKRCKKDLGKQPTDVVIVPII